MATDTLLALCTCPDEPTARRLAGELVDARLAACVNLLPGVRSVYRWEGTVHDDTETLLLIKSTPARWDALAAAVAARHPYSNPELIAVPVTAGLAPYLSWVQEVTA